MPNKSNENFTPISPKKYSQRTVASPIAASAKPIGREYCDPKDLDALFISVQKRRENRAGRPSSPPNFSRPISPLNLDEKPNHYSFLGSATQTIVLTNASTTQASLPSVQGSRISVLRLLKSRHAPSDLAVLDNNSNSHDDEIEKITKTDSTSSTPVHSALAENRGHIAGAIISLRRTLLRPLPLNLTALGSAKHSPATAPLAPSAQQRPQAFPASFFRPVHNVSPVEDRLMAPSI